MNNTVIQICIACSSLIVLFCLLFLICQLSYIASPFILVQQLPVKTSVVFNNSWNAKLLHVIFYQPFSLPQPPSLLQFKQPEDRIQNLERKANYGGHNKEQREKEKVQLILRQTSIMISRVFLHLFMVVKPNINTFGLGCLL